MFFVSDMPGGYGGTDIYFVKKVGKDKWSEPINLGDKVNTEGNEMFPYYEERSGLLFFASNGRAGLGGLDVFVAVKTPKGFDMVENVGAPINSKWDDFAYIIDKKLKNGYFSSNRPTGKGGDDIYSFKFSGEFKKYVPKDSIFNYTYRLFVLNEETKQPIPKAKVMLDVVPTETNKEGMVSAKFDANTTFDAVINATGYVEKVKHVDIKNPQNSAVITDTVYLSIDKNRRIVLKNIYYDFDKWDILPESAVELDKLVDFMKQNPQLKVELSSHTDCRGSDKYNMRLSEKRAKSAVDYIVSKGVDVSRITAVGYGETRPVNKCVNGVQCSEQEHRQNRRTEVYIQDYGRAEDIVQTKGKH
jgi:outer membrane protein OmpA-like peptidoglycan-associated protein